MILSREIRPDWSTISKIIFRFIALYFWIYIFFMFAGRALFESLFVWVGRDILHMEGRLEYFPTGSGDTTMGYVSLFTGTIFTIIGTIIWSIFDRKRPSYNQLFYWMIVILRIFLIFFMFTYGFVKVFKAQFPGPSLVRLLQPLGEMSPMGLAWTYMGHSEGFNMFVGFMEVLGGLLLIPRKTLTLGAFITVGVMTQVAMMNLFYDIPVKLFSIHLIAMALVIFLADWKRFTQVFIKNETAPALAYYKVSEDSHYKKLIFWFKIVMAIIIMGAMSWQGYQAERLYGDKKPKPPLYGIWKTTMFVKNNDTLPPMLTDTLRWKYLIVDRKGTITIKHMDDKNSWYAQEIDTTQQQMIIHKRSDTINKNTFTYIRRDSILHTEGIFYKDTLSIDFKAKDLSKIELINRGFHWINEYPYNR